MKREIFVDLSENKTFSKDVSGINIFGKELAIKRILQAQSPDKTVYVTGFTPMIASGLGFAGKINVYGISKLGNNLQGSRSGGRIARYLTKLGIVGISIEGQNSQLSLLHINENAEPSLIPLSRYGEDLRGTFALSRRIFELHGNSVALALTDPGTLGFRYNAIVCNSEKGKVPDRVAGRGSTHFGPNGLIGIIVDQAKTEEDRPKVDKKALSTIVRKISKTKANILLKGSSDQGEPLLGGTYGAACKARFAHGHGLTNLFRDAHVPDEFYGELLPDQIVREQLRRSEASGIPIRRHSCIVGCPNKCSQMVILQGRGGEYRIGKAGEWETYQGVINLGLFDETVAITSKVIEHSNEYAYDHIEGLVALAALALVTESKQDTGVRYGDKDSVLSALDQAVEGRTELGQLLRAGAAEIEKYYGIERHFTVGGHALPFHNGRSMLQTGIGLSWTFGRHGESCAGPGRHNFVGQPYDPSSRDIDAKTHIMNTIHGMILYGAVDHMGMCFFVGPSVDTVVDCELIGRALGFETDARKMIRDSARTIRSVHDFNAERGVTIQSLPNVFYERPTHGNSQTVDQALAFDVPFDLIRDYGREVLEEVADGKVTVPDQLLEQSKARYP